jgi:hypothetical protein
MTSKKDDRTTITFETPVPRGNKTLPEVQLRKPAAGELRGLSLTDVLQLDVTAMHKLLPRITAPALTEQDVAQLDPVDLVALSVGVAGFFTPKAANDSLTA